MNISRILISAIAATIVFFICGFLIFGLLIAPDYAPFTGVYRSSAAMNAHMSIGIVSSFVAMLVLSMMYAKGYEGGLGLLEGFRFGALAGLLFACKCVAEEYVTLNISGKLVMEMAVGVLVEITIVGMVIGLVYKPRIKTAA